MKKVFIDTDVVIDFLTKRPPFITESLLLFEYAAQKKLKLFISSLSVSNIYYVISRIENKKKAREKIKTLLQLVDILPVAKKTIEKSILSEFKDFEDGIQNFCAAEGKLTTIITRNTKDYSKSKLSIQTPSEFLVNFKL